MKLLFAHDHIFYKFHGDYYSNGSFPKDVLLRYTSIFDKVHFISRQQVVNKQTNKMSLSTTENVEFINIPNFKSIKKVHKIFEARKIIKSEVEKADCVIARSSSIGSIAVEYAKKTNKPYVIEVVACPWDALWNYGRITGKMLAPFSYYKLKKIVKNAPYVLYVTNQFLQNRYPTNGMNISCSNVKIDIFEDQVFKDRLEKINSFSITNKIVFGTAAAVNVKFKGQQYVIEALSRLSKQGYDVEYQLAGNGDHTYLRSIAQKLGIEDKLVFLGAVPHHKIFSWMDNIDVYIQPSKQEGLPRAVLEAMSRACPVIGSNAGGIPELVDKEYIFSKGSVNDLVIKMIDLLTDKEEMSGQARTNFNTSKKYNQQELDIRRSYFLSKFKQDTMKEFKYVVE
ncbi:glycosyltransferase family 4 protein [Chengkuizengella axinellae]|uniref:Glycosyltransferase family 4 protein n=1 Tax=Chengkuizengella axinellae TaxID=3064388 RepID=A0ABT9IZA8_9BACL|nr:glycosyltransferase family 4 protein [Chengkuizengella sp. 2205SS18-9]MDP5274714.1 glycosyltransferase family 4 protein [Chengkuizengella sp. 2205SS18-9]